MQAATPETVLGTFDGSSVRYLDTEFEFRRSEGKYSVLVRERGSDAQRYEVPYTFGFYPLQQYLAKLPGGRLQALPVAWDSRAEKDGGQRWYALESDLPWQHVGFNWNTSCAECHSTGLQKNYDVETNSYDTRWDAINVDCAACHGDGEGHRQWLQSGMRREVANKGFPVSLNESGHWQRSVDEAIAHRQDRPGGEQLSTCGQCHSRRSKIGEWHPGLNLLDHTLPATALPPLYFGDGQIRDEVFVAGSFMQSKMHAAGVVCSNCHEPHSLKLRAEGDALCLQCHSADTFATPNHHGHDKGSAACIDCHMPATTYMGVDARRDHRFSVPMPALSQQLGSPNPCRSCHTDNETGWPAEAEARLNDRLESNRPEYLMARLAGGDTGAAANARYQLDTDSLPVMIQSVMLELLGDDAIAGNMELARSKLSSADAMVRVAAMRSFERLPLQSRWAVLKTMLTDSVGAVRMEAARILADMPHDRLAVDERDAVQKASAEYLMYLKANLDNPAVAINLGGYYAQRGDTAKAEQSYQQALVVDPQYTPAFLQLAELDRQRGDIDGEQRWLAEAVESAPDNAQVYYARGMHRVRQKDYSAGIEDFEKANQLSPYTPTYVITLAIALENRGDAQSAMQLLDSFMKTRPQHLQALQLAARYALKYKRKEQARKYLQQWLQLEPGNPQANRWLRSL